MTPHAYAIKHDINTNKRNKNKNNEKHMYIILLKHRFHIACNNSRGGVGVIVTYFQNNH